MYRIVSGKVDNRVSKVSDNRINNNLRKKVDKS